MSSYAPVSRSSNGLQGTGFSSSHAWRTWLASAVALVVIDQMVKAWVSSVVPYGATYFVTTFLNIVYTHNPGAAFSFLSNAGRWQRWFFLAIAIAAAVFLSWLIRRGVTSRGETIAYVAILGGAVGNAVDRARLGYVVDFLDFHWNGWHWPAFNSADAFITCGAVLMLVLAFGQSQAERAQRRV